MAADTCTLCPKPRRGFGEVLEDFGTLRTHLHLALHTPEILSRLREAMVLVSSVESEIHGLCRDCAHREAAAAVQHELDICSRTGPQHLRHTLLELLEQRHARHQQHARHLRLVTEVERG